MKNVIEFKKDCIMKTSVDEITDISLSHDYKVHDDTIEGYFDVSGEYKITKASVQKEDFTFTIPFTIALSSMIDRSSINLTIKDFRYSTEKDVLHLNMFLNMDYEEQTILEEEPLVLEDVIEEVQMEIEESQEEIVEEEKTMDMDNIDDILKSMPEIETPIQFHNEVMLDSEKVTSVEEVHTELEEKDTLVLNSIISNAENAYYKYKIYIMREEDTIESVAIKYNVTLDDLKEYNDLANINKGDKIIIPFINNVQEQ